MKLYIAYGSNMNVGQMAMRCPSAVVAGTGILSDYELVFRGRKHSAYATIEPKEGSTVPVVAWQITPMDERALDQYEGYPRLYGKQKVDVEMNVEKVSAMVYVMTPGHAYGHPSELYLNIIRDGYRTAGIDTKLLDAAVEHTNKLEQSSNVINHFDMVYKGIHFSRKTLLEIGIATASIWGGECTGFQIDAANRTVLFDAVVHGEPFTFELAFDDLPDLMETPEIEMT